MSTLDTAALVIEGCAVREKDPGTMRRLYDEAARIRAVSQAIAPSNNHEGML